MGQCSSCLLAICPRLPGGLHSLPTCTPPRPPLPEARLLASSALSPGTCWTATPAQWAKEQLPQPACKARESGASGHLGLSALRPAPPAQHQCPGHPRRSLSAEAPLPPQVARGEPGQLPT